jgi:GNAT superfamily N-acetyltransferase
MDGNEFRIDTVVPTSMQLIEHWRQIHNEIVPVDHLTIEQVIERSTRNLMHVGFVGEQAVACSTLRPPQDDAVVVIVRVLPSFRNAGLGSKLYAYLLQHEWVDTSKALETVVLKANTDGLTFALNRGFEIVDEYEIEGAQYIDLRLIRSNG